MVLKKETQAALKQGTRTMAMMMVRTMETQAAKERLEGTTEMEFRMERGRQVKTVISTTLEVTKKGGGDQEAGDEAAWVAAS